MRFFLYFQISYKSRNIRIFCQKNWSLKKANFLRIFKLFCCQFWGYVILPCGFCNLYLCFQVKSSKTLSFDFAKIVQRTSFRANFDNQPSEKNRVAYWKGPNVGLLSGKNLSPVFHNFTFGCSAELGKIGKSWRVLQTIFTPSPSTKIKVASKNIYLCPLSFLCVYVLCVCVCMLLEPFFVIFCLVVL